MKTPLFLLPCDPLRSRLVLLAAAGLGLLACSGPESKTNAAEASGTGGAGAGGAPSLSPGARPPARPTGAKTGPGGTTRAFIARKYFLGAVDPDTGETDPKAWQRMGYDFDGVTTTPAQAASDNPGTCQRPTGATLTSLIDGDEGRDNNFGSELLRITGNLGNGPDTLERDFNATDDAFGLAENLIVVIEGIEDGSEDGEIHLGILSSAAVGGIPTPRWDGTDRFPIDGRMVLPGTVQPRFAFSRGYMVGNTVVSGDFGAPLEGPFYLPLGGGGLTPLDLRAVTFAFDFDPTHKQILSSTFAAVVPMASLVKFFYTLLSVHGSVTCGTAGEKQIFTLLNPTADLSADLPGFLDTTGASDCDAISWGWRINWAEIAVPTLDDVVDVPPIEDKCAGGSPP